MVLYSCVLIVFSLHRELLMLILEDEPLPVGILSHSTCNVGTSALLWNRSYGCKTQEKQVSIEEVIGTQTEILPLFPD
jgi:hypothetical protein